MKQIFYIWLLLWSLGSSSADAQTTDPCNPLQVYTPKHDGTGTLPYTGNALGALELVAKDLAKVFPAPFCNNFKVFDYGFTPTHQYTKGGYAEDFEVMKLEALGTNRDGIYLLFAREVDAANRCTKIWVDINFPKGGKFACMTEVQRSLIKIRVEKATNRVFVGDNHDAHTAEMQGIIAMNNEMVALVKKLIECCGSKKQRDCVLICPTKTEMKDILLQKGFISLGAVRVKAKNALSPPPTSPNVINNISTVEFESDNIVTFADDIAKELAKRKPSKVYLTDDDHYCKAEGFESVMKHYEENLDDYDVMLHLSETDDAGVGELWVKINAILFEDDEEEDREPGAAKFTGDPNLKKYKQKIVYGDMFRVGSWRVPSDAHLLRYNESPSKTILYQHEAKPAPSYLFDLLTGLYWGYDLGDYLFVPENELTITAGTKYKICLIKKTYEDGKSCFLVKTVKWSSSTPPKNAQNLDGIWSNSCFKQANNFYNDYDLLKILQKYNLTKTIIKHISSDKSETYISKDGINQPKPFDDGKATIIEIKENGDGTVTPKVATRVPQQVTITRDKGKGKSGQWNPSAAKPAFEAAFKEAIKEAAREQGNTSYEPKINPAIKSKDEKILDSGWGGLPTGVSPGIEYKGVDILEKIAAGVKTFNEVVDNAKIPDEMWQNPAADDFPVKDKISYPSGALNAGMSELKGSIETFGMIANAVMNPGETAKALGGFASGLASWDGATQAAGGFITGIIGLDLEEYNKSPEHKRHATGVVIGTIAAQAVTGSLVLSLTDIKNAPGKFNRVLDKLEGFSLSDLAKEKYSEAISAMAETTSKLNPPIDVERLLERIGCLTGNTLVEMKEGEMQELQTVKEGDLVNSYNHSTQQKELKSISKIQRFFVNSIMMLTLSTGNVIEATPNHPFYVRGEYRQAQDLHIGDTLFSKNDKIITLNRIFAKDTTVEVFNLLVADNDNYFAGEDAVLTKKCILESLGSSTYAALNDKVKALSKEARARFLSDFAQVEEYVLNLLQDNSKLLESWKKGNLLDVDLLTVNKKVNKPGGRITTEFKSFEADNSNIHPKYLENQARFDEFLKDPATGNIVGTGKTRKEAMAILEFEEQGFVKNAVRDPTGAVECFDGVTGKAWDVKTLSTNVANNYNNPVADQAKAIQKELRNPNIMSPISNQLEPRNVILDTTFLSDTDLNTVRNWMSVNLTPDELSRVTEINVKIK
jgi:hypothetical protein